MNLKTKVLKTYEQICKDIIVYKYLNGIEEYDMNAPKHVDLNIKFYEHEGTEIYELTFWNFKCLTEILKHVRPLGIKKFDKKIVGDFQMAQGSNEDFSVYVTVYPEKVFDGCVIVKEEKEITIPETKSRTEKIVKTKILCGKEAQEYLNQQNKKNETVEKEV